MEMLPSLVIQHSHIQNVLLISLLHQSKEPASTVAYSDSAEIYFLFEAVEVQGLIIL
jgi:hypothetical protein